MITFKESIIEEQDEVEVEEETDKPPPPPSMFLNRFETKAREAMTKDIEGSSQLYWRSPVRTSGDLSTYDTWWSKDFRYQITRVMPHGYLTKSGANAYFAAQYLRPNGSILKFDHRGRPVESDVMAPPIWTFLRYNSANGSPQHFKSLPDAFRAVEQFHLKRFKLKELETNSDEVIVQAKKKGWDKLPGWSRGTEIPKSFESNGDRKPSREPGTPRRGGGGRLSLLGYPVTAVLRYMGANGWTYEEAIACLKRHNCEPAEATIRIQLTAGKKGNKDRGEPAPLTPNEVKELKGG